MDGSSWVYGMASVRSALRDRLSLTVVRGVVTYQIGAQVLMDNARWLGGCGAGGQVVDYREAAMAINEHDLMRGALAAMAADPALETPTALLVHPADLPLWDRYCSLMARAGVLRAPFVDPDAAAHWARCQANATATLVRRRDESRPEGSHTAGA